MISRIWHGWTNLENADSYERLLKEEIFVHIGSRKIKGFRSIQLLKRESDKETEFITIMHFETIDSIKEFAGEDYETAVVPDKARQLLKRFDERSQHYEIIEERKQSSL